MTYIFGSSMIGHQRERQLVALLSLSSLLSAVLKAPFGSPGWTMPWAIINRWWLPQPPPVESHTRLIVAGLTLTERLH